MTENANSFFQLLDFERLLQNCDRSLGQDPVEHRAVRITSDDNDRTGGLVFLDRVINIVSRTIGQFQIEKYEIEFLFLQCGERFFHRSNNHPAEADFAEEQFEKVLQAFVVVDDQDSRLAGFFLLENVLIEGGFFDSPAPTDLDGGELTTLNKIINGRQ